MKLKNIEIRKIHSHPDNPRKDLGDINELAESIRANGVMQNLTVVERADGEYTVIIGHRRLAASLKAGLDVVPCAVVKMDEKEQQSTMLVENMQRSDLTVYEQAQGFQMMLDLGSTEDEIAEKTGFSKQTVKHRINLAKLDPDILKEKNADENFQMTLKDMYELEKIDDVDERNEILSESKDSSSLKVNINRYIERQKNEQKVNLICEKLKEYFPDLREGTEHQEYRYFRFVNVKTKEIEEIKELAEDISEDIEAADAENVMVEKLSRHAVEERVFIMHLWKLIIEFGNAETKISAMADNLKGIYKSYHVEGKEDLNTEKMKNELERVNIINQMWLTIVNRTEYLTPYDSWDGKYRTNNAELILEVCDCISVYGYYLKEEDEKFLNNESELKNRLEEIEKEIKKLNG